MCLKSFWEALAIAKMKTYLLSAGKKNLGAAKRKLNQFERLFTVGEVPLAKRAET